jgi:hypothetical protein
MQTKLTQLKSHYKNHNTVNIAKVSIVSVHNLLIKRGKIICKSGTYNRLSNIVLGYISTYDYLYE